MVSVTCTPKEMMAVYGARELKPFADGEVLIGIGMPVVVTILAKNIWCPNLTLIIENGSYDLTLAEIPYSMFGMRITYGCSAQLDNLYALSGMRRGRTDLGFIGGAQVDKYGSVNSTHIGPVSEVKGRLAGSGGAVDIGCYSEHTFIIMQHAKRNFVEKVDYVTTPGWICPDYVNHGGALVRREEVGLPGGPYVVISNLGIMKFDQSTGEMYLDKYYPGVTVDDIIENTGFHLDVSRARMAESVTEEELMVLRKRVDPLNLYGTR